MQITDKDPLIEPDAPAVQANIFCVGDNCKTSLDEEKSIGNIKFLSKYVYNNIILLSRGM